jgi:hypothetical protein
VRKDVGYLYPIPLASSDALTDLKQMFVVLNHASKKVDVVTRVGAFRRLLLCATEHIKFYVLGLKFDPSEAVEIGLLLSTLDYIFFHDENPYRMRAVYLSEDVTDFVSAYQQCATTTTCPIQQRIAQCFLPQGSAGAPGKSPTA